MRTEELRRLFLFLPTLCLTTACGAIAGGGDTTSPWSPASGLSPRPATIAFVGEFTACRRTDAGTVECWGSNGSRILGPDAGEASKTPVEVAGVTGVSALAGGAAHACALGNDGAVTCWGGDYVDSIGDGKAGTRRAPPTKISLPPAVEIAAGAYQTCARTDDARVFCWGSNVYGEAGSVEPGSVLAPAEVTAFAGATSIHLAGRLTCARIAESTLRCFGMNPAVGTVPPGSHVDVTLPAGTEGIAASWDGICVLLSDGTVQCAGTGASGALGDGTLDTRTTFAAVSGVSDAAAIYATVRTICSLSRGGDAKCWGEHIEPMSGGDSCQHGDYSTACALRPASVGGVDDVVAVAAAHRTLCVEHARGGVECFGALARAE